jgi:hypothetical protein
VPISPADRARYPRDWAEVSIAIRRRAGFQCECEGECGRDHGGQCQARGQGCGKATVTKSGALVVLTVAHLWRGPCAAHHAAGEKCGIVTHLKAMCQACHLAYDMPHHVRRAWETRWARRRNLELPLEAPR